MANVRTFALECGIPHCDSLGSTNDALHGLRLGMKSGSIVIVTMTTTNSAVSAVAECGRGRGEQRIHVQMNRLESRTTGETRRVAKHLIIAANEIATFADKNA